MTEWQTGVIAFQEGRLREAADRLRLAAIDQEHTVMQDVRFQTDVYLGAALYALGQYASAAEAFETAVKLCPSAVRPYDLMVNLANAYVALGLRRQAIEALSEALQNTPGAMDARQLLSRLQSVGEDEPLSGSVLGDSPESARRYMETLSFATVPQGYAPDQVRAAFGQINRYVNILTALITERDQTLAQCEAETERLRVTEETLVSNLLELRQEFERVRHLVHNGENEQSHAGIDASSVGEDTSQKTLTPLEKLWQKRA